MTLYSLYADIDRYAVIRFDRDELRTAFGANPKNHIDTGFKSVPFKSQWKPVHVSFENADGLTGNVVPDISEFKAKLFLSRAAYEVLHKMLEAHGEFLEVSCSGDAAFIFNPLRTAEEFDAVNDALCVRNEWGDIVSMAFDESKLAEIPIFKSKVNNYQSINCNDLLKIAVEKNSLKGIYFTEDLGCPHTSSIKNQTKLS